MNRLNSWLPGLVLALLVVIMVGAWWGFPYLQSWIARNDCIATGRTNC